MSKRLGALALRDLRAGGVEPMALVSLMARLGSADPVELRATLDEVVAGFELSRFGSAPTKFDEADLAPLTARALHGLGYPAMAGHLAALGVPEAMAPAFWEAVRDNVATRAEIADWWRLCRDGAAPVIAAEDADFARLALGLLPPRPWDETSWGAWTAAVKEVTGRKGRGLFQPLRRLLTGRDHGPEMARLMPLLRADPR